MDQIEQKARSADTERVAFDIRVGFIEWQNAQRFWEHVACKAFVFVTIGTGGTVLATWRFRVGRLRFGKCNQVDGD
jgi:hypothetical protein